MHWSLIQSRVIAGQLVGFGHVSPAAHLGGSLAGFVAWLLWRTSGKKSRE
jgi:hypothetical protein